jgi:hypothetical protein
MALDRRHGVNAVDVMGTVLLLTTTSGGTAVHLAREELRPGLGRAAVRDAAFDPAATCYPPTAASYDRVELLRRRWATTTLCGREWAVMPGGDGGPLEVPDAVAFAPSCRRCLAVMDDYFPAPAVDDRLLLVARLAAHAMVRRGYVEVRGVPGDQQVALRRAVRADVRELTGHTVRTLVDGSTVLVTCDALRPEDAAAAEAAPPPGVVVWGSVSAE